MLECITPGSWNQGQRRHVKSGGAKNGNIASALELC